MIAYRRRSLVCRPVQQPPVERMPAKPSNRLEQQTIMTHPNWPPSRRIGKRARYGMDLDSSRLDAAHARLLRASRHSGLPAPAQLSSWAIWQRPTLNCQGCSAAAVSPIGLPRATCDLLRWKCWNGTNVAQRDANGLGATRQVRGQLLLPLRAAGRADCQTVPGQRSSREAGRKRRHRLPTTASCRKADAVRRNPAD